MIRFNHYKRTAANQVILLRFPEIMAVLLEAAIPQILHSTFSQNDQSILPYFNSFRSHKFIIFRKNL